MRKRSIGISCGIIATLYVTQVTPNSNLNHSGVHVVSAEETCTTEAECDEQIKAAQRRISDATSELEEAENIFSQVEEDWSKVIARIETTQIAIEKLESQIKETSASIENHKEELVQLDEEVIDLQELVGYRMRIAQRMNNGNEVLEFLTESETIVEFIRRVRIINHLSKSDAELMEELNTVIERQQNILSTLQKEQIDLTAKTQQLELEEASLAADQKKIENSMATLGKQIEASQNAILDEEEALKIAEAQKEVLAQLEIPLVMTDDISSEESTPDNRSDSSNNQDTSNGENNNNKDTNTDGNNSVEDTSAGGNNNNGNTNGADNNNIVENNTPPVSSKFIRPMSSGVVTCEWMCYTNHRGIDISHSSAVPILAVASGLVTTSGWSNSYGNWVVIEHNINGERYGTVYAHLRDTPMVQVGETVTQGQQLGNMGNTGISTGPHLHFEIHPGGWGWNNAVNPRNYISFPPVGTWY